jgi:hypothetical protein
MGKSKSQEIVVRDRRTRLSPLVVEEMILTIRGQKVILDADLARIYGVETRVLNQAVKRNRDKFPEDFAFLLAKEEDKALRSQIVIASHLAKRPQSATGSRRGGRRYAPIAFTEHGAIMAATVLNSPQAVKMSVFVVRAFIKMREQLLNRAELGKRLAEIEKGLLSHDTALRDLYRKIRPLLLPPPEKPRRKIGFGVRKKDG